MKRKPLLFLLLMTLFMPLVMNSQGLMKAPRGTALQAIGAQNSTRQETPQNRDGWLQYDDGNCLGGTGSSTAYYWTYASMYPASMLGNNNTLSQIAFYENTNMYVDYGVTIDIYSGGNDAPGNLIYSEDAALNGSTGMHVVELASPVTIDPTQNLWISITVAGTYVLAVCSSDEPNNSWVENDGWYHLSDLSSSLAGYGWMIRGYVEYVTPDACPKPTGLYVDNVTGHTAILNWNSTSGSTWQICVDDDETHLITTSQNPYTLTGLSPETDYNVKVRTKCSNTDISNWTSDLAFTTDVACPTPEDLATTNITSTSASIGWTSNNNNAQLRYRKTPASNDFEDGTLGAWTTIDADGDGYDWYPLAIENIPGHDGSLGMATSASYSSDVLYPDNYLVSPQITLGGSISFYACAQDSAWAAEHFGVAISTNGNTNANDFITIQEWTMNYEGTGATKAQGLWGLFTVDLSAYSGQGYVAIRHFNCSDMFRLNVDDITIVQPGVTEPQQWTTINNASNPQQLTGLTPETSYQVQVRSNCASSNDGYSLWTNGFFTTMPACQAPTDLTITNITTNSAVVTWTGSASSYNLKVNDQTYNNVTSPYTLSNLTIATVYTVEVQSVCSATSTSIWTSTEFVTEFCEEADKCLLTFVLTDSFGDTWNGNAIAVVDATTNVVVDILTNDYDNYTATGASGAYTQTKTLAVCKGRQLQFVWIAGSNPGEASWIISDVNGEEINSGTGSYDLQTGAILATYTVDCTITSCRKPTDLQATEVTANSVTLSWTENGEATAWFVWYSSGVRPTTVRVTETTVTINVSPETSYTVRVRPDCDVYKWSDNLYFTTPSNCPLPSDITVDEGSNSVTLNWTGSVDSYNVRYRLSTVTSFEDGTLGDWTTIDADGDGYDWYALDAIPGHNGSVGLATSASYQNVALNPDNYLVSPQVTLGGSISFYACAQDNAWPSEHFGVAISTTGNTNAADFTTIAEWTMNADGTGTEGPAREQGAWGLFTVDLSDYAGQTGYVAIRHFNCSNWFRLNVDDITINQPGVEVPWIATLSTTETTIDLPNLEMGTTYEYQMQSVCGGTPTAWSTSYFFITIGGNVFITDGDWNNGNNWSGGTTPEEGSNVTIRANVIIPAGYTAIADQITIEEGGSITIADGGQLKHNTELEVTMKKFVPGYTGSQDNYKLLAFPFKDNPVVPEGMTAAEGNDFYAFSNSAVEEEWQNNKVTAISSVNVGRGYLYANPEDIELSMTGTTFRSYGDYYLYITANYIENENGDNSGWKLAGNPFTSNAYIYGVTNEGIFPMDVMYYDANGDMQTIQCGPVAPMQGFFVKVTETTVLRFYSNPLENRGNAKNLSSHAICLDKKMDKAASQAVSIDKRAYKNVAVVEKKADKNFIILDKKILNKKIVKKLANNDTYSRFKEVKQALPFKK